MNDEKISAGKARKLSRVSSRQLKDWDQRGAVNAEQSEPGKWRKYSPEQLFSLMVFGEIRNQYGIPVERLKFVSQVMNEEGAEHLQTAVNFMRIGYHVFLLTDLEKTFVMHTDLEIVDLMRHGLLHAEETQPFILLRLNGLVNRLLGALKDPICLETKRAPYDKWATAEAHMKACSLAEIALLQSVRDPSYDRVEVKLRDGEIKQIDVEGPVAEGDVDLRNGTLSIQKESNFETVTLSLQGGKLRAARRRQPSPYDSEKNEPLLYGPIIDAMRGRS